MSCIKSLKRSWKDLAKSRPGERFQYLYARRQRRRKEHPVRGFLVLSLGIFLVVAGIVLWITPVLPGFFLSIIGMGMLAQRIPGLARVLDRVEMAIRQRFPGRMGRV